MWAPFIGWLFLFAVPANGATFNDVLPGARPMGMGMAFASISDDPYALFYNPAGIAGSNDFQLGGSFGRMFSPVGPLSYLAIVNTRPFPWRANSNIGAAYFSVRQSQGGDKDQLMFHYSEPVRYADLASLWPYLPELAFLRPIKFGANFKIINVDYKGASKLGIGLDGGMQLDSGRGLKVGLSMMDFTSELGVPNPSINLGASYLYDGWILVASDVRMRPNLTEIFPGAEFSFFEGLLKARIGKGLQLDGVGQVAFGFGVNFSPMFLDFAMTAPWAGINRPGSSSQITLNYKFGAPSFYGRYIGSAARQAEELKTQITELEDKKKTLESQVSASRASADASQEQLKALETRLKSLQDMVRNLERKLEEKSYRTMESAPHKPMSSAAAETRREDGTSRASRPASKPKGQAYSFPRKHTVMPGDTLRSLANQYYGDPNLWEVIYDANRDKVERGLPQEGTIVTIPPPTRLPEENR